MKKARTRQHVGVECKRSARTGQCEHWDALQRYFESLPTTTTSIAAHQEWENGHQEDQVLMP